MARKRWTAVWLTVQTGMAVNAPPSVSVQNVLRTFGSGLKLEKQTNTTMTHRTLGVRTYSVINHKMSRSTYETSQSHQFAGAPYNPISSLTSFYNCTTWAGTQAIIIPYVPFWYALSAYQASLVELKCPWRAQWYAELETNLICSRSVPKTVHGYITNTQCDQLPDAFIAQLVRHCSGIAEVMGSNPVQAWIFFGL